MHNEWRVVFSKDAESDLATLDRPVRRRVIEKIEWLELNFKLIVPQTLRADRAGQYKLRAGDWRIIYTIDDVKYEIKILVIDHRGKVYNR